MFRISLIRFLQYFCRGRAGVGPGALLLVVVRYGERERYFGLGRAGSAAMAGAQRATSLARGLSPPGPDFNRFQYGFNMVLVSFNMVLIWF